MLLNYERLLLDEVRLASQNSVRKELMLGFFSLIFSWLNVKNKTIS